VPYGWIAGLVAGLILIPIAQKKLFRKVAERNSGFSLPPNAPAPAVGAAAPAHPAARADLPLPEGAVRCSCCGNPTPSAAAAFDDDGRKLCPACDAANQIDTGDRKALAGVRGGAYSAPAAAFVSLFFNPFWIMTVMAVAGGFGAVLYFRRNPEMHRLASPGEIFAMQVCGVLGAIAGIAVAVLTVQSIVGAR
jgi:hypothetical protein